MFFFCKCKMYQKILKNNAIKLIKKGRFVLCWQFYFVSAQSRARPLSFTLSAYLNHLTPYFSFFSRDPSYAFIQFSSSFFLRERKRIYTLGEFKSNYAFIYLEKMPKREQHKAPTYVYNAYARISTCVHNAGRGIAPRIIVYLVCSLR